MRTETVGHLPGRQATETAVGMIGCIVLDRATPASLQRKRVMSVTREPRKARMGCASKGWPSSWFPHDELEWLFPVQDVPEKYGVYGDSDW